MSATDGSSFTTPDGTRLVLYRQGPREAAPTVVFVHGWVLDARTWEPVANSLASTHPVVRYDLRGHGRSGPVGPGTATIAQLADDLADLLGAEVEGPVVLVGHSLGGMAIMALAQRHPELVAQRVAGVVFAATSCGDLVPHDLGLRPWQARVIAGGESLFRRWAMRSRWFLNRGMTAKRPGLIRPAMRWLNFGEHPRRADVTLVTRCIAASRPASLVGFRAGFDEHHQVASLRAFRHLPALVLGGTRDRLTPIRHTDKIASELPDATLVRYEGAGHMVLLERAEQVASRIGEVLAAVESGRPLPAE
ncbi:MAG: alpha/beta fold hydrolase [Pseudonocardiaceae bacterium]